MWSLKCTIISVIIGVTGIVTKSLRKNLEAIPGKHSIDSLQLGSTTDDTITIRHTGHVTTHYMIYHPFDLYFKLLKKDLRSSLMMAGYCRNM
jgi:hypothetical protein